MKVRLDGVSAKVYIDYVDHLENLVRELRVVASGEESGMAPVIAELGQVLEDVLSRYERAKDESYLAARTAAEQGQPRIDLEFDLPPEAADHAEALLDALERVDEIAERQALLTLPASPAVVEFRRWAVPELVRQLRSGWDRAASADSSPRREVG